LNALSESQTKQCPTLYENTPVKKRLSNHPSAGCTRNSVDNYLQDDLNLHTRGDIPLEDFLFKILGFGEKEKEEVECLKISESTEFTNLRKAYFKAAEIGEVGSYLPFVNWGEYIIGEGKKVNGSINFRLHDLGKTRLNGDFGYKEPDVAATAESVSKESLNWENCLLVFEFKRRPKRKAAQQLNGSGSKRSKTSHTTEPQDSEPVNKASGSKRQKQTKQLSTDRKKRSSQRSTNKGKSSKHQPTNAQETSGNRPRPAAPGYNASTSGSIAVPSDRSPVQSASAASPSEGGDFESSLSTHAEVQLSNYATQLLSSREFRQWTVSVLIKDEEMTLWYYDRSRAFKTKPFNFKANGKSFVNVMLALAFCSIDRKNLGFGDKIYEPAADGYRYMKPDEFEQNKESSGPEGNEIPNVDLQGKVLRLDLKGMVHRQFTLFGRATRVEDVEVGERDEDGNFVSHNGNYKLVLKVAYQVHSRCKEYEIINMARKVIPEHTPAMLGYRLITSENLKLPGDNLVPSGEELETPNRSESTDDGYEKRDLVLIIMRKYDEVWDLEGEEFMNVFRQGVQGKSARSSNLALEHRCSHGMKSIV